MVKKKQSIMLLTKEFSFWLCFLIYSSCSFYLFYNQATADSGYLSDMPAYIDGVLGTNQRDPYPYRLFFWVTGVLNRFLPIGLAAAFATLLFNSLTVLILRHFTERYFCNSEHNQAVFETGFRAKLGVFMPIIVTFAGLMASMVIIPINRIYRFSGQYYIGQGSGNVWHNATYLATRPFATLAFFLFIEIMKEISTGPKPKKLILFSASMFLTVFAKPTFALVMIPTIGIVLLISLIKERFRNFKQVFFIALTLIPAALDGLRQYFPVFAGSNEAGIGFGFGDVWSGYTNSILLSVILCFLFSIYIIAFNLKGVKHDNPIGISLVFTAVALFEGIFLFEKGLRMPDGNFLQGYLHAMFFLFIISLIVWLSEKRTRQHQTVYDITALVFFLMHIVSGIWYFAHLLAGNSFY